MLTILATLAASALLVESGFVLSEGSKPLRAVVFTASVATGAIIPWAIGKAWIGMVRDMA